MRMGSCISRMSLLLPRSSRATCHMMRGTEVDADVVRADTPARTPSALLPRREAMQR